jgi:hypothetical protein
MGKDLVEVLWVIARAKSPSCCLASEESCCLGILVVELGCKDLAHSDKITSASAIMRSLVVSVSIIECSADAE